MAYPAYCGPGIGSVAVPVGVRPAFLPRAFQRFSRADPARAGSSTGLGLAIVAALVHRNGGAVHAANHPDGGAQVTLHLPHAGTPNRSAEHPAIRATEVAHP